MKTYNISAACNIVSEVTGSIICTITRPIFVRGTAKEEMCHKMKTLFHKTQRVEYIRNGVKKKGTHITDPSITSRVKTPTTPKVSSHIERSKPLMTALCTPLVHAHPNLTRAPNRRPPTSPSSLPHPHPPIYIPISPSHPQTKYAVAPLHRRMVLLTVFYKTHFGLIR